MYSNISVIEIFKSMYIYGRYREGGGVKSILAAGGGMKEEGGGERG